MRSIRINPRSGLVVAGLSAALLFGACGGEAKEDAGVASLARDDDKAGAAENKTSKSSEKDVEKAFLAFAECMREHGIDMPDPVPSDDGTPGRGFIKIEKGPDGELDDEKFRAADAACRKHLEGVNAGAPGGADPAEFQDRLVKLARCMREKGFDMPDPKFEGGRAEFAIRADEEDPKFREARQACSKQVGLPEPGDVANAARAK